MNGSNPVWARLRAWLPLAGLCALLVIFAFHSLYRLAFLRSPETFQSFRRNGECGGWHLQQGEREVGGLVEA